MGGRPNAGWPSGKLPRGDRPPGATRRDTAVVVDDGAAAPLPPLGRINDPADIAGAVA